MRDCLVPSMVLLELAALVLAAAPAFAAPPAPPMERLTLEEAVRRAIARNPTALIAEEEIRRAEGIVKEVRAGSLPTLTANAGAVAAATGLTNSGLFDGQSDAFFAALFALAKDADSARRGD